MEKVRPWCSQPSDQGRLKNRTEYRNAGRSEVDRLLKGKASPYSITERRVPELIPVLGSQPAGDVSHKPGGEYGDMVKIGHAVPELRSRTDRQPHTHTHTHRPIVLTGPPKLSLKHCLFCCRHSISCRIETKWAQSPITASICLDGRQFSVRHPFTTARASAAHRACKHLILYATPAYLVNKRREVRT